MDTNEFWLVIGTIGGTAEPDTVAKFEQLLFQLPPDALRDLGDMLLKAVADLQPERFIGLKVTESGDPIGAQPVPLLGDSLAGFLLAVIAAGPEAHAQAVADPYSVLAKTWRFEHAGMLMDAVTSAHNRFELPWPDELIESGGAWEQDRLPWCNLNVIRFDGQMTPEAYHRSFEYLNEALTASAEWNKWWGQSGFDEFQLILEFGPENKPLSIRRNKRHVRASASHKLSRFDGMTDAALQAMAVDDLQVILAQVAQKISLRIPPRITRLSEGV